MPKIIIVGALPESLLNFRGDLLKALVAEGYEVSAMASDAESCVTAKLAEIGVSFRRYPVQRNGMNPVKDIQTLFALRRAFRELKPDIIMAYTIKPVIWGGLALSGNASPRYYALVTGLGFSFQSGGLVRRLLTALVTVLYRRALARSSRVIFQNLDDRRIFIEKHIVPEEKCSLVNGSGVDLMRFARVNLPVEGTVFLTIGRLLGEKGFREYARAAFLVKSRFPQVTFQLLGPLDPSPDGISIDEVDGWVAAGSVEYLGSTSDVRPFLSACHVYVLPSYHEGMPRTVLEAMATGRPILTTDVPGCRETVIPGDNGWLVPKGDIDSLAERMIWFIENPQEWQRMGMRSRQIAEERFDVHKVNREMMAIMGL